jgi:UDP-glucose 4-epimerase
VEVVLRHPETLRRPLVVADPEPLTVGEIVAAMREGLGRAPGIVAVPEVLVGPALRAAGRGEILERLSGSLVARPDGLSRLGWRPPVETRAGLAAMARSAPGG